MPQPCSLSTAANRLDWAEAVPMLVEELHERGCGRSSSAAKKLAAALKDVVGEAQLRVLPLERLDPRMARGRQAHPEARRCRRSVSCGS